MQLNECRDPPNLIVDDLKGFGILDRNTNQRGDAFAQRTRQRIRLVVNPVNTIGARRVHFTTFVA